MSISLLASETPIDSVTAAVPSKAAATDPAPAPVVMVEASLARMVMLRALTWRAPLPSMKALTSVEILFSTEAPDPLRAADPVPPPAMATEIAATVASTVGVLVAVMRRSPAAVTVELRTKALTSRGERVRFRPGPSTSQPM